MQLLAVERLFLGWFLGASSTLREKLCNINIVLT